MTRPATRFDLNASIALLALAALVAIVFAARARGIWLDEFWSQRLGDPSVPLGTIISERWLSDTHPPLANLLYRLVAASGVTSVSEQRLLLNLPALFVLTAATTVFARRSADAVVLFASALALTGTIETFSDFRSYAWQIGAITVLCQYVGRALSESALTRSERLCGYGALFLALSLHYVTAILVSIGVAGLIGALWWRQQRGEAIRILSVAVIAWISLLWSGLILLGRIRRDMDFGWIQTSTPTALLLFGFLGVTTLISVPLVAFFAAKNGRAALRVPDLKLRVGLFAGTAIAGFAALILLNLVTPIIVQRYLIAWQLTLVALIVALATPLIAASRWRLFALVAVSILMIGLGGQQASQTDGWNVNRDRITAQVRACPATRVYALSPWALKTARGSNAARRETVVVLEGYRRMAREAGFAVTTLELAARPVVEMTADCPTLVWVEHIDPANIPDASYVLRLGGLVTAVPVESGLTASGSGVIVTLRAHRAGQNRRAMPK